MKLNISYPANGSQKVLEVEDERKLRPFMEKRMGTEVSRFPPSGHCIRIRTEFERKPEYEKKHMRTGWLIATSWLLGSRRLSR